MGGSIGGIVGGVAGGLIGGGGGGGGVSTPKQLNIGFDNPLTTPGFDFRNGTLTAGFTPQANNPFRNALTGFLLGPNAGSITTPGTPAVPGTPGSPGLGSSTPFSNPLIQQAANSITEDQFAILLDPSVSTAEGLNVILRDLKRETPTAGGTDFQTLKEIEALQKAIQFDPQNVALRQQLVDKIRGAQGAIGGGGEGTPGTPDETIGLDELAENTFGGTLLDLRRQVTDTLSQLDPLRSGIQESRGDIQALRDRVAPGFGELTEAAVNSVLDAGAQSIGNLRDSLAQRQVLGSSFANDAFSRTRLATGRAENEVRAQAKIAEIGLTADLIQNELATFGQEFGLTSFEQQVLQQDVQNAVQQANLINTELTRQLEEFRIAGGVATATAQAATSAAIANAQLDAAASQREAANLGASVNSVLGGLGGIFASPGGGGGLGGLFGGGGGGGFPSIFA